MRFSYSSKLKRDLANWKNGGLIEPSAYTAIIKEVDQRSWGLSFSNIVSLLGIISLCFAAMTFVAANWEDMSRLTRVAILIGAMWLCYGLSAYLKDHANGWYSQILVLLGSAIFGASIMLVSQMYHMQGEQSDAILLWTGGTMLAAMVLRSVPALILSIILLALWHTYIVDIGLFSSLKDTGFNFFYLFLLAVAGFGAWWMKSRISAHLILLGALYWLFTSLIILSERHDTGIYFVCLYLMTFLIIAILLYCRDVYQMKLQQQFSNFDSVLIFYLVVMAAGLLWLWMTANGQRISSTEEKYFIQSGNWPIFAAISFAAIGFTVFANVKKSEQIYDVFFATLWLVIGAVILTFGGNVFPFINEAYALAFSIWLIRMGGRQDIWQITRIGYMSFAAIMLTIYFRTAGSLLGTSGFYLTAGVVMVFCAVFLPKLFKSKSDKEQSK